MEVMLAIAIFGLALVAIGELIRIGSVSAAAARDLTEGQRLCNNVMSEVGAGIIPPESASESPIEGSDDWLYSIEAAPLEEQEGMLRVSVTVTQDKARFVKPATFTLVRWMSDPAVAEAAAAEAAAATAETTSSSPASSTGGTSTSGGAAGSSGATGGGSGGASGTKTGGSSGS